MLQFLIEDRNRRDQELAEDRYRREAALEEERQRREEERQRQAEEAERRAREVQQQMHLLQGLVQGLQKQGEVAAIKADRDKDVKLTKLTERDDIEAYLTTFERLITTYEIKQD